MKEGNGYSALMVGISQPNICLEIAAPCIYAIIPYNIVMIIFTSTC